jgi:hypothetical protein
MPPTHTSGYTVGIVFVVPGQAQQRLAVTNLCHLRQFIGKLATSSRHPLLGEQRPILAMASSAHSQSLAFDPTGLGLFKAHRYKLETL